MPPYPPPRTVEGEEHKRLPYLWEVQHQGGKAGRKPMKIRDRITELRRVKASDLRPNPRNWRTHPEGQRNALSAVLAEVGYADALLARELPDGTLELVDGHLRAETTPDMEVPVLVLDVDEAEADKILATLDPLAGLAEANEQALGELLASIETDNAGLQAMLEELAAAEGLDLFEPGALPDDADGKEFDESCADDVEMVKCPKCDHEFPK